MSKRKKTGHTKWSYQANIYEVNVRQYTAAGTFEAFAEHLPRLKDMGVKILWFMPVTPISVKGRLGSLGSYYAAQSYVDVNPEFGTLEDFKQLVKKAHEMDFKVILDFVANHTGNDHPWIKEHPAYYVHDDNNKPVNPHGWTDVSELDYTNKRLRAEMVNAMKFWVKQCDIDGFRCDMAHLVPLDFWINARKKVSKVKDGLFWLAECEEPEYHEVFDATYTWRWMHASHEFYQGKMNLQSLLTVLYKSVTEFPATGLRAYFTTNHDENSWNGTTYEKYGDAAQLFAVFSCTWNGIPLIYSGQELPNKKRLKFFDKDQIDWTDEIELHHFYKTLLTLKAGNPALRGGDIDVLTRIISHPDDHEVFSFLRKKGKSQVLVVLNCCHSARDFEVKQVQGVFRNVFGGPDIHFGVQNHVSLDAWGYLVFEKIVMP